MTPIQQKNKAIKDKRKGEKRLRVLLAPWIQEIATNYRIGQSTVIESSIRLLSITLERFYNMTAKDVLSFDIREFKQLDSQTPFDEQIKKDIANAITVKAVRQRDISTITSSNTASKWVERTSHLAIQEGWTEREAQAVLTNYLRGQRLTIATTQAQWIVETSRRAAVVTITDPLENTLERIVNFIEGGDINAANRLSREVSKLSKLPISQGQGVYVRAVRDNRSALLTPITQGEALANLRRAADEVDKDKKEWQTVGDNDVRETHSSVNGQERRIEEPFILAGGVLQYPGDGSLGATLKEIINCRCATVYL